MNLSVFTDLRYTSSSTPTGVGKHIEQMTLGLRRSQLGAHIRVIAAKDQLDINGHIPLENKLDYFKASRLPCSWKVLDGLWTLLGGPPADRFCMGADWVYCPKNDFIPLRHIKLAVTIHGAHELDPAMPQTNSLRSRLNRIRRRISYRRIVQRADLILTVSEFLKGQLIDWFDADETKIEIVGNGVEEVFFEVGSGETRSGWNETSKPYLLCVGGLNTIDGGREIVEVAKILKDTLPEFQFLVAGWQHDQILLRQAENLSNIKLLGYVEAAELAELMGSALALLYLTHYETFGIAAAEAMAAGTPVITAGGSAVPEIVGDAALYVTRNPYDIVENICKLANDPVLWASLRAAGLHCARKYTWQACVDRLLNALETRT